MKNSCHAPLTSNTVAQMQKLQKHFSAATKYIGTVYAIIAISTKTLSVQFNVEAKASGFRVKEKPSICYGGITHGFVHATKTEAFLLGKQLSDPSALKGALRTLSEELVPHSNEIEADPMYRKNLAFSLLYKAFLAITFETLDDKMKSAVKNVLHRDVSKGTTLNHLVLKMT